MLSRRNARIKVMQMLYSANRDQDTSLEESKTNYWEKIDQSIELLHYTWYVLTNITKTAVEDAEKRKKKYLPNEEDKKFTPVLYENKGLQTVISQKNIQSKNKSLKFGEKVDNDILSKIYYDFAKSDAYKEYVVGPKSAEDTEAILLELFRFCRANENFLELMEDQFINWEDDKSIIIGTIKKIIKRLKDHSPIDFNEYYPDKETTKDFGEKLLVESIKNDKQLLKYIEPVLDNWDSDRVAIIDLILLKMAVSELIRFTTVPTKVTINEYVELAKNYSTPKSKEFVNGILDTLVDGLKKEGIIKKEGRGLVED